jgi:hypothetical protein
MQLIHIEITLIPILYISVVQLIEILQENSFIYEL